MGRGGRSSGSGAGGVGRRTGLGGAGQRRRLVVHVEDGQLRADDHKGQVVVPDPGFGERAMDEHIVEILLAVPALAAAVQKEENGPAAALIGIVTRGQIEQEVPLLARGRAVIGDMQQLRCVVFGIRGGHGVAPYRVSIRRA